MQMLETAFYFIVTLGVLVFVHEFGHFIAAKLCKMRVDRFSIGFPPRAFGKKIGDTDYCVSWIPIGGYVKIAGMVDESMDIDFLEKPPEPWEFRARPLWQRMLVISAGVIMNLILAVVIFWAVQYSTGRTVFETTEVGTVVEQSPAEQGGIKPGDKIIRVNGAQVTTWQGMLDAVYTDAISGDVTLTVMRGSEELPLTFSREAIPDPGQTSFGIVPVNTDIVISTVEPGKPADQLGLKPMDVLLSINGTQLRYDQRVRELVRQNAGKPILMEWRRGTELMSGTTTPTDDGRIGISFGPRYNGPVTHIRYSVLGAFPQGLKFMVNFTGLFIQQVWQILTGQTAFTQSVGGPIKIAQIATQSSEQGLLTYLSFMALLSINLAILNIFPFPALDGGHLMFLIYEGIFRREVPAKIKIGLQKFGLAVLLAFMAFVVANDIFHF
ncbi:MAG: RIP metalloprotease RseP [Bacteroidota bacterium]